MLLSRFQINDSFSDDIRAIYSISGKLAPIFMKKKEVEEPKKVILDPEQERLRREFLMSGVPEALKKQTVVASAAAVNYDFCPFPAIKHVQQEDGIVGKSGIDIWKLSGVKLKYITLNKDCQSAFPKTCWKKNFLEKDNIMCDLTNLKVILYGSLNDMVVSCHL